MKSTAEPDTMKRITDFVGDQARTGNLMVTFRECSEALNIGRDQLTRELTVLVHDGVLGTRVKGKNGTTFYYLQKIVTWVCGTQNG